MIPFVKLRQQELMKGIKWPQIKGNLGSKAYIYVGVAWIFQLVWDSPSSLVINTPGNLCSTGPHVWLEMHQSGISGERPVVKLMMRASLVRGQLSSRYLSLWLGVCPLGLGCMKAGQGSFVCIALWHSAEESANERPKWAVERSTGNCFLKNK